MPGYKRKPSTRRRPPAKRKRVYKPKRTYRKKSTKTKTNSKGKKVAVKRVVTKCARFNIDQEFEMEYRYVDCVQIAERGQCWQKEFNMNDCHRPNPVFEAPQIGPTGGVLPNASLQAATGYSKVKGLGYQVLHVKSSKIYVKVTCLDGHSNHAYAAIQMPHHAFANVANPGYNWFHNEDGGWHDGDNGKLPQRMYHASNELGWRAEDRQLQVGNWMEGQNPTMNGYSHYIQNKTDQKRHVVMKDMPMIEGKSQSVSMSASYSFARLSRNAKIAGDDGIDGQLQKCDSSSSGPNGQSPRDLFRCNVVLAPSLETKSLSQRTAGRTRYTDDAGGWIPYNGDGTVDRAIQTAEYKDNGTFRIEVKIVYLVQASEPDHDPAYQRTVKGGTAYSVFGNGTSHGNYNAKFQNADGHNEGSNMHLASTDTLFEGAAIKADREEKGGVTVGDDQG